VADREIGNVKIGMNSKYYLWIKDNFKNQANSFNPELIFNTVGIVYSNNYRDINTVKTRIDDLLNSFPDIGAANNTDTRITNQGTDGILLYKDTGAGATLWELYNDVGDLSTSMQQGLIPSLITDEMIDFSRINMANIFDNNFLKFSVKMTENFKIPNPQVDGFYYGVSGLVFFNTNTTGKYTPLFYLNIYPFLDANDGLTINGKINLMD